eukprot:1542430-Amphidinium_carterae.1
MTRFVFLICIKSDLCCWDSRKGDFIAREFCHKSMHRAHPCRDGLAVGMENPGMLRRHNGHLCQTPGTGSGTER